MYYCRKCPKVFKWRLEDAHASPNFASGDGRLRDSVQSHVHTTSKNDRAWTSNQQKVQVEGLGKGMLVNISQSEKDASETISSLFFTERARSVELGQATTKNFLTTLLPSSHGGVFPYLLNHIDMLHISVCLPAPFIKLSLSLSALFVWFNHLIEEARLKKNRWTRKEARRKRSKNKITRRGGKEEKKKNYNTITLLALQDARKNLFSGKRVKGKRRKNKCNGRGKKYTLANAE